METNTPKFFIERLIEVANRPYDFMLVKSMKHFNACCMGIQEGQKAVCTHPSNKIAKIRPDMIYGETLVKELLKDIPNSRQSDLSAFERISMFSPDEDGAFNFLCQRLAEILSKYPKPKKEPWITTGSGYKYDCYDNIFAMQANPPSFFSEPYFTLFSAWLNGLMYGLNTLADRPSVNPNMDKYTLWLNSSLNYGIISRWDKLIMYNSLREKEAHDYFFKSLREWRDLHPKA